MWCSDCRSGWRHRYAWYIQTFSIAELHPRRLGGAGARRASSSGTCRAGRTTVCSWRRRRPGCRPRLRRAEPDADGRRCSGSRAGTIRRETGLLSAAMSRRSRARGTWNRRCGLLGHQSVAAHPIHAPRRCCSTSTGRCTCPARGTGARRREDRPLQRTAFSTALTDERRARRRFERPAALIIADLDRLRDVNNTYGHLVGDEVLEGVAGFRAAGFAIRRSRALRRRGNRDPAPGDRPRRGARDCGSIRRAVAEKRFDVEASDEPVRVTVSMASPRSRTTARIRTSSSITRISRCTARSSRAGTACSEWGRSVS